MFHQQNTYNWVCSIVASLGEAVIEEKIKATEIDQRWHFWRSKKQQMDPQSLGLSYRANLWSGFWLVVMRQREENDTISYHR